MSLRTGSLIVQYLTGSLLLTSCSDGFIVFCLKQMHQRERGLSNDGNCSVLLDLEARCSPCTSLSNVNISSNYLHHWQELRYCYTIYYIQLLRGIRFLSLLIKNEVVDTILHDAISLFLLCYQ